MAPIPERPKCLHHLLDKLIQSGYQDSKESDDTLSLGWMASDMAHRINNPLMVVLGCAEVLKQRFKGDEETLEDLARIVESVDRCRAAIQEILDLTNEIS